jgi:hypothetical protein
MLVGEEHIGQTILDTGEMLINLHLADTNRMALGTGTLDLAIVLYGWDTLLRSAD